MKGLCVLLLLSAGTASAKLFKGPPSLCQEEPDHRIRVQHDHRVINCLQKQEAHLREIRDLLREIVKQRRGLTEATP